METISKLTWREIHDYISKNDIDLDSDVVLYNCGDGEEYKCIILEHNEENAGWVPKIAFNVEELED